MDEETKKQIIETIETHKKMLAELQKNGIETVAAVAQAITASLEQNGTVYLCGKGGMRELLEKGGQVICPDFSKLGPLAADLLNDKKRLWCMAVKGKEYARQFTLDYFKQSWIDLISSLRDQRLFYKRALGTR